MSRLKNPSRPPALYYVVSLGGAPRRIPYKGISPTIELLYKEVVAFYNANADPIPEDLRLRIEDQVCNRQPLECWPSSLKSVSPTKPRKSKLPLLNDVLHVTQALADQFTGNVENQPAIDYRTQICKDCPKRLVTEEQKRATDSCGQCGGRRRAAELVAKISKVAKLAGNYTISPEIENDVCGVCGCFLSVKLPLTGTTIKEQSQTPEEALARPETCWQNPYFQTL